MVFSPLVKAAMAVFACTDAALTDQERTAVPKPFFGD
jgi:hypothetical protein